MRAFYALAVGAAFAVAAPAVAADVIDFEGSTTTEFDDRGIQFDENFSVLNNTFGGAVVVPSGTNYAQVGASGANITFSTPGAPSTRAVTDMFGFTIAGLSQSGGFYAGAVVSVFNLAGTLLTSQTFAPVGPNESRGPITFDYNAPGIARVQFDRIENPNGGALFPIDDVRFGGLSAAGVPEPSVWAFLILGFGAVGGAMRRSARTRTRVRFAV